MSKISHIHLTKIQYRENLLLVALKTSRWKKKPTKGRRKANGISINAAVVAASNLSC